MTTTHKFPLQDLCYYNNECQYAMAGVQDFGNVFSNVGYIILGLFFSLIVAWRWYRYKAFKQQLERLRLENRHGIPEQFGIFTSLGIALVLEGVLSGCYHICPTKENFQFDTTFMFFIALLLFLKVIQFRHPNLIQTSHRFFLLIGVALIEETLGYYINSIIFTIIFIVLYVIVFIVILFGIYYNGDAPGIVETYEQMLKAVLSASKNPREIKNFPWAFINIILLNIMIAIYILVAQKPDSTSMYLLAIFMVNMALYVVYYTGIKVYRSLVLKERNESIRFVSWFYCFLAFSTALPSLYFFRSVQRDSNRRGGNL